jgi:hydrogenase maturation protease
VRTVVVGIGNDFRGDDGAGLAAARLLKKLSLPGVSVIELNGEVTRLVDSLQNCDTAILIDAVQSQKTPGTIHRFDVSHEALPGNANQRSTHGMSLSALLELARTQGQFPQRVVVYGIEGEFFDHGRDLSPRVELAISQLVDRIHSELLPSGV